MAVILQLDGVSKRYGAVRASDDLSMHLDKGEALGVIGPNGSGKTTMFNIITGITKADRGQVFFDGMEITGLPTFQSADVVLHDPSRSLIRLRECQCSKTCWLAPSSGADNLSGPSIIAVSRFWRKLDSQRNQMSEPVA